MEGKNYIMEISSFTLALGKEFTCKAKENLDIEEAYRSRSTTIAKIKIEDSSKGKQDKSTVKRRKLQKKKKVYRIWKIRSNSKLNRNADKTYSLPNHRL
ncbi:hypothetical protein ACS0TY_000354 [Phlomoides rotata]